MTDPVPKWLLGHKLGLVRHKWWASGFRSHSYFSVFQNMHYVSHFASAPYSVTWKHDHSVLYSIHHPGTLQDDSDCPERFHFTAVLQYILWIKTQNDSTWHTIWQWLWLTLIDSRSCCKAQDSGLIAHKWYLIKQSTTFLSCFIKSTEKGHQIYTAQSRNPRNKGKCYHRITIYSS
jgi:hypothetical protein